jgi:hypothetical protein
MSTALPEPTPDDPPAVVLDHLTRLRRQTRVRSRSAWLPLLLFALLTMASTLLYRQPFYTLPAGGGAALSIQPSGYAGLPWSDRSAALSLIFWLVAAPLCYLGCAMWYQRRAQRRGLSLRWQTYVRAGLALLAVLALALVAQHLGWLRLPGHQPGSQMMFGPRSALSPLLAIALGLLALARVERSWGVAVVATLYGGLATVMEPLRARPAPTLDQSAAWRQLRRACRGRAEPAAARNDPAAWRRHGWRADSLGRPSGR